MMQVEEVSHGEDESAKGSLIEPIGRDLTIKCLMRTPRAEYSSFASLNRSFRTLMRSGEIYKLRRMNGVVEHWVYFSSHLPEWEAFDPVTSRWMHIPKMDCNQYFISCDKESLAVGTQILVFGRDISSFIVHKYSLLTNSWSLGKMMNSPRCLFGSASLGHVAVVAGGCNHQGCVLKCSELYDSETETWENLPPMNKPRKLSSGVFMDGKFYVIGGIGETESELLTCGEEFDLETRTWKVIPNMSPVGSRVARENEMPPTDEAPPLLAVANNQLYAADYADMDVKKYNKVTGTWVTLGRLPEHACSTKGWGLAFRGCGDRLVVIGGRGSLGENVVEVSYWVADDNPPEWVLFALVPINSHVSNCAVMAC